ncbi:MAG: HDIG domain-containing protein [Candidatus Krumholzibacteriota bacterium]|nr:HDIG domain-containing protein [Candidatus Krumholzibacteriota bacterium]
MSVPTRKEAYELLTEYTKSSALIKHALSVESAMRFYAHKLEGDVEYWGAVGLLHDFDYERYPSLDDHPFRGAEILREKGYDEDFIDAILSHADHTGVARTTAAQKALFAVDELCGFVTAVTLVRPSKKLEDVRPKSVSKKLKDKAFARAVSRSDIDEGAKLLDLDLPEHIANVIEAMQRVAPQLGL